jgi:hypothetical protein
MSGKRVLDHAITDARTGSDLFKFPLIDGVEALGEQLDPLAIFKSFKKIRRKGSHPFAGSEIRPADERDGISITTDVSGNGEEIGGVLVPADEEECKRKCLV